MPDLVVITGGFGALGSEVVKLFAEKGAEVAIIDRAAGRHAPNGARVHIHPGIDISDVDAARLTVKQIATKNGGRIDALINIAGAFRFELLADETDSWDLMYRVNLTTALNMCRVAIPFLVKSNNASVVNIGALGALNAARGMAAYAASKAAVHKLTEAMADEFRGRIRVNAVMPSVIDTPQNRRDMPQADFSSWVSPRNIAAVIHFLCSQESRAITGALLPLTGPG